MKYAEGEQCPSCGSTNSEVIDIRYRPSLKRVVRRRRCKACGKRWNTVEIRIKERRDNDY
ncbi:MAG: hypothetical protein ACLTC0_13515 [Eisenbergiella massiliensis]|uniref:NrdR family transcriptional regulator n=1 Tax=Eisenbergiella massiliensis TaxID=1720294 RepID=UPI00399568A7